LRDERENNMQPEERKTEIPNSEEPSQAQPAWPVIDGSYRIGDPAAPVAVCALTSDELLAPLAGIPGVAIAGEVQTANQGIERIIMNITANPAIRFLLLCGKESRLFRPGQSLSALVENGTDDAKRIVGAEGYEPVLRTVTPQQVATFRRQVELVDWSGEQDLEVIRERISSLAVRNPGRFEGAGDGQEGERLAGTNPQANFAPIRPGGHREPLIYDPKGYFVITLDRSTSQIILRHYLPDHTPAHEMRGRTAESMMLGLIRENLVSQLSHAGYLGGELAKAESALRLGLRVRYEQDRPLRSDTSAEEGSVDGSDASPKPVDPPRTTSWEQFTSNPLGQLVDVTMEVTAVLDGHLLEGTFARPAAEGDWGSYRRTDHVLRFRWSSETRVAMGNPRDFKPGAILRTTGTLRLRDEVETMGIAVLTKVVTIE
jgi:tetrahydromethanopterin S-methyltransferase subunit A